MKHKLTALEARSYGVWDMGLTGDDRKVYLELYPAPHELGKLYQTGEDMSELRATKLSVDDAGATWAQDVPMPIGSVLMFIGENLPDQLYYKFLYRDEVVYVHFSRKLTLVPH